MKKIIPVVLAAFIALAASPSLPAFAALQPGAEAGPASGPAAAAPVGGVPAGGPIVTPGMPTTGPAGGAPGAGAVGAPGQQPLPPGAAARPADFTFLFLMGGMLFFLIFMSVMTGRKEKKRRAQLMSSIKKNDRVLMSGGMIGTLVEIKDDEVLVRFDEGRIRFSKSAVQAVINSSTTPIVEPAKAG